MTAIMDLNKKIIKDPDEKSLHIKDIIGQLYFGENEWWKEASFKD